MLKNVLNKIKSLLGKKAVIDLDNDGKIESYRLEVEGVFSQFKRMHNKLGEVITNLEIVAEEEKEALKRAEQRIQKAQTEIELNKKLQDKVNDFII